MKVFAFQHFRAGIASALMLTLAVSLSGCQALSPRVASPTPTPILLGPQEGTAQPTRAQEATAAAPAAPASPPPAQVAPVALETSSASAPTGGIMGLGTRATITLRALPTPNAEIIAQVLGSQIIRAQGRTSNGDWLWVTYDETGRHAWAAAGDVKLMGDVSSLAEIAPASDAAPATGAPPARAILTPAPTRPLAAATQPLGKIVFQTASGGDIYLVSANGSGLRRLTDGIDPVLSPDGTQIVFARWGAPHGVFVLNLSTGEERRVASANRPRSPAWSPDGSQIAFVHLLASDVCLDSPFGCLDEATLRARFGGQDCLATPFGTTCIQDYPVRSIERTGIALIDAAGQGWLDIGAADDAQAITWRPGSEEILYRGAGGLQITAAGGASRPLVQDAALGAPAWSPDGARVVVQVHLHDHTDLFLLDAAGNRVARLTTPSALAGRAPNNVAATWAPDGRSLLFLSDRDGAWRIYQMRADGSQQTLFLPQVLGQVTFRYDFAAERVMSWGK